MEKIGRDWTQILPENIATNASVKCAKEAGTVYSVQRKSWTELSLGRSHVLC